MSAETGPGLATHSMTVGVVASQGGFEAHKRALTALGVRVREVRNPDELDGLGALVLPGGESTSLIKAFERDGMGDAIVSWCDAARPLLATCAGMIVLDSAHLGVLDLDCRRNAYGRQLSSFETETVIAGCGPEPFRCVFIRAPKVLRAGAGIEVLAEHAGDPVLVRSGNVIASSFHPELSDDGRIHALLMAIATTPAAKEGAR